MAIRQRPSELLGLGDQAVQRVRVIDFTVLHQDSLQFAGTTKAKWKTAVPGWRGPEARMAIIIDPGFEVGVDGQQSNSFEVIRFH